MRLAICGAILLAFAVPATAQPAQTCAPTGLEAERLGVVIHLSWDDTPGATGYTIYRAQGDGNMSAAILLAAPANETIDTQVEPSFDYTYRVTATVGGVELPDCGSVVVPAGGPCVPEVDAVAGPARIDVHWTPLPVADAYHLYRGDDGQEPALLGVIDASTQGYIDTDIEAGATYEYEVRAVVDGDERSACSGVIITSIPFFPGAAWMAGIAVAGLAYLGSRRR